MPAAVLAAATYVPMLATEPGRVGADTKTYLYLDPGRLLSRAWSMWDPSIGLGTVTHQNIGYLWPIGPWYWAAERLGLPDWVAQRLWLATILFTAGLGVLWLFRSVLGWRTLPATVAAFSYACTPYVLTLGARISVILLPFAGLPWLIGLAALALRRGGWRHPALFALVVASIGSVNATALALAGLGPVLWLVSARVTGEATTRQVARTVGRIGALTLAASAWWLAGLWAQGGYGIDILRYTETAEVVASASVANEVLRGLGYWFFYGGDRLGPWIEPGVSYTQSLPLLTLTYALPIAALAALGTVRFRHRGFFVALLGTGVVAAVGAHPWDGGPPLARGIQAFLVSDVGLAMRSLPRAAPLVALGLAAGLGAGVDALAGAPWERARRLAAPVGVATAVAAYAALPPLWTGGMVASNLDRPEEIPSYWEEVAAALDARDDGTRVLALPGADFASYRWGNTVDPVLPGLMDRPYVARELIPYGTPASADLLNALDRRVQERTLDPDALAPLARLLGVGDIVLRDDLQFERYRTPRPYVLAPFLEDAPGLGRPLAFGPPTVNDPVADVPLIDELALAADDREPRPPVEVFPVEDPVPIVRAAPIASTVVVAGDGEGLVDVAEAGLLDGSEVLRYAAELGTDGLEAALADGAPFIVTDQNRRQGRRWSTVRDTLGHVEGAREEPLVDDLTDNRLPVFPGAGSEWFSTAVRPGGVEARATSYGNPITFTPEFRATNAVDGDLATEWRTGASADVRGERLTLSFRPEVRASGVTVVQQLSGFTNRHITEIDVRVDGGPPQRFLLDESSRTDGGQVLDLGEERTFTELDIEIVADSSGRAGSWGRPVRFNGLSQVGFAEVDVAGRTAQELVELPVAATSALTEGTPFALVLSRWRSEPTEAVRADPEPTLDRGFQLPLGRSFELAGDARLAPRAGDALVDALIGVAGPSWSSSSRLTGIPAARASAAADGDPATWWSPAFGDTIPTLHAFSETPVTLDGFDLTPVDDGRRSLPLAVQVHVDGREVATVPVPPGGGTVALPAPATGREWSFAFTDIDERLTTEWFSNAQVPLPIAIAEFGAGPLEVDAPVAGAAVDTGCRDDLVRLDDGPLPVRVRGTVGEALAGGALSLEACGGDIDIHAGAHTVRTAAGLDTGIDIDRLVLGAGISPGFPVATPAGAAPAVRVIGEGRNSVRVRVQGATPGEPFWLELGQSFNVGWEASGPVAHVAPVLVDGYANAWLVDPTRDTFEIELAWRPQRVVNAALVLSAIAVLACAVLALRRPPAGSGAVGPSTDVAGWARFPAGRRPGGWLGLAAGVAGVVAIGPVAGAVLAAAGLAAGLSPRSRAVLAFGPAVALGAAAAFVLARQAIARPTSAFEWPAELATAHQPALVAVGLLVVVTVADAAWGRRATLDP